MFTKGLIIMKCLNWMMKKNSFLSSLLPLLLASVVLLQRLPSTAAHPTNPRPDQNGELTISGTHHRLRHHMLETMSSLCFNPCGVHQYKRLRVRRPNSPRDLQTRILNQIKRQINTTITYFEHSTMPEIKETYRAVMNLSDENFDGLFPGRPLKEFNEYIKAHPKMSRTKKVRHILPKLYHQLQTYCVAFEDLLGMKVHTESSDFAASNRTFFLNDTRYRLRAVLCDVQTGLNLTNVAPLEDSPVRKVLPKVADLTTSYTRDVSTYKQYVHFMEDWQKIIRRVEGFPVKAVTSNMKRGNNVPRRRPKGERRNMKKDSNGKKVKINKKKRPQKKEQTV